MGHQSPGAPPLIVWTECKEEESLRQVAKATKDQKIGRLIFFCPQHVKFQQVQQVSQDNLDLTRFNQESWRKWSKPREHGTNLLSSNCHTKGTTLYDPSQSIQPLCLETHAWGVELKRPAAQLGPVGNHNSPPRQENINRCPRAPWFSCPSLVSWNGAVLWGWPFLSGIVQRETRKKSSSYCFLPARFPGISPFTGMQQYWNLNKEWKSCKENWTCDQKVRLECSLLSAFTISNHQDAQDHQDAQQ